jgi:segregation and condensation protein B
MTFDEVPHPSRESLQQDGSSVDDGAGRTMEGHAFELRRAVEAILFASGRPLPLEEMEKVLRARYSLGSDSVERLLEQLQLEYPIDGSRGFELALTPAGWCFRTNRACRTVLEALFDVGSETRLTAAAYETLAVIAYLQPVTRSDIAEIRGVNPESSLRTLLERDMVREVGRLDQPGRAALYATTPRFLRLFGLAGLEDLPPCESFAPSAEERGELRRRLGVGPGGGDAGE